MDAVIVIEGVEFDSTVFDTDDLSTIRGASLALIELPSCLDQALTRLLPADNESTTATRLYAGASRGAWLLRNLESTSQARLEDAVYTLLQHPQDFAESDLAEVMPHLSFSVGAAIVDGDPGAAESAARARAASNQYARLSLSIPKIPLPEERFERLLEAWPHEDEALPPLLEAPCAFDLTRPVDALVFRSQLTPEGRRQAVRDVPASASVAARRRYGRTFRRDTFYNIHADLSDEASSYGFADDFEEIASESQPKGVDANLHNRMAVIHMDGNAFGKIRKAWLKADKRPFSEAMTAFSSEIERRRQRILASLFNHAAAAQQLQIACPAKRTIDDNQEDGGRIHRQTPVLRFETLLWGADESLFVFPAWGLKGVLAALSESITAPENQDLKLPDGRIAKLSYAIGIIICSYKFPVRQARKLAEELADNATESANIRQGDFLALQSDIDIMLLAGNEVPIRSLSEERQALYGSKDFTINATTGFTMPLSVFRSRDDNQDLLAALSLLKGAPGDREIGIPRGKVAAILKGAKQIDAPGAADAARDAFRALVANPAYRRPDTQEPFGEAFLDQSCFAWAQKDALAIARRLLELWNLLDGEASER